MDEKYVKTCIKGILCEEMVDVNGLVLPSAINNAADAIMALLNDLGYRKRKVRQLPMEDAHSEKIVERGLKDE